MKKYLSSVKCQMSNVLKGFTLVELLVVVAIIGILAATITVSIGNQSRKSRDARRKQDMETIKTALNKQELDKGSFNFAGSGRGSTTANIANGDWRRVVDIDFLADVPVDPLNAQLRRVVNSAGTSINACLRYFYFNGDYDGGSDTWKWKISTMMESAKTSLGGDSGTNNASAYPSSYAFEIFQGVSTGGSAQPSGYAQAATGVVTTGSCP